MPWPAPTAAAAAIPAAPAAPRPFWPARLPSPPALLPVAEGAAKIAAIMGMAAPSGDKMVAHVLCNGGTNAVKNFEYRGVTGLPGRHQGLRRQLQGLRATAASASAPA